MRICEVENCGRKHQARGMCHHHYDQFYRKVFYKPTKIINWEEIKEKATIEFEEWKARNKPFKIDFGKIEKLLVDKYDDK